MTRWLLLLLLLGCPRTPTETTPEVAPEAETHEARVAGVELRVLPRETEGLVEVRLYIDAGTLDGSRPSAAVVTAWALENEALTAEATPHRLELRARVAVEALDDTLEAVGRALAVRDLTPERHAELVARWRDEKRHAHAQPLRRADALALVGLLGQAADPFAGEPPSIAEVEGFMRDHLGTDRSLLVIVGDVEPSRAEAVARRGLSSAPSADGSREDHAPGEGGVRVDVLGNALHGSVAVEAGTREAAMGLANRALRSGVADSVLVYPHAAGVALLLRASTLGDLRAATWLAHHGAPAPTARDAFHRAIDPAEAEALRWRGAEGERSPEVAVGVVCPHGSEACEARATEAARAGTGELGRRIEADRGTATFANGARIMVVPRRSRDVAFALRFSTGGTGHGDVVVLAHALARRCGVDARLDATGFSLVGGGAAWKAQLQSTIDCVTAGIRSTTRERLRVVHRLRERPERGWIAAALSPGMTSRVAPEGRLFEVADATSARARARLNEARAGRRVMLAIVGNVSMRDGLDAAPMLGSWAAGDEAVEARWGDPIGLVPQPWNGDRVRVVLGWRHDRGHAAAGLASRAFAGAVAERLAAHGRLLWHDGDGGVWGAWAAVALDVLPEDVDALPEIARSATTDLQAPWSTLAERERWRSGDVREVAWRVARFGRAESPPSGSELARVVRGLTSAEPVFAIGRGQNAAAHRRLRRN